MHAFLHRDGVFHRVETHSTLEQFFHSEKVGDAAIDIALDYAVDRNALRLRVLRAPVCLQSLGTRVVLATIWAVMSRRVLYVTD